MACNCIDEVNKKMAESGRNTMLDIPITFSTTGGGVKNDKVTITTCKRDDKKREKALRLFPAYCPFCGKLYDKEQVVTNER